MIPWKMDMKQGESYMAESGLVAVVVSVLGYPGRERVIYTLDVASIHIFECTIKAFQATFFLEP